MTNKHSQQIECEITFLPLGEGRATPLEQGALTGDNYRPHLVVNSTEEYLGVSFHMGPTIIPMGKPIIVILTLVYHPQIDYKNIENDSEFTIREGAKIVGYGKVLRWL